MRVNNFKKTLNSKCNSHNRFNCKEDKSLAGDLATANNDVASAHLFYNSVDCAKEVLSSRFTSFSFIGLILLALLI